MTFSYLSVVKTVSYSEFEGMSGKETTCWEIFPYLISLLLKGAKTMSCIWISNSVLRVGYSVVFCQEGRNYGKWKLCTLLLLLALFHFIQVGNEKSSIFSSFYSPPQYSSLQNVPSSRQMWAERNSMVSILLSHPIDLNEVYMCLLLRSAESDSAKYSLSNCRSLCPIIKNTSCSQ
jgi:hypothetical protein